MSIGALSARGRRSRSQGGADARLAHRRPIGLTPRHPQVPPTRCAISRYRRMKMAVLLVELCLYIHEPTAVHCGRTRVGPAHEQGPGSFDRAMTAVVIQAPDRFVT